jgi:hypothetical protein
MRTDIGSGVGSSLFVGQRTFETRSLYLILAEKLFTLPAAHEMLPLSALFAGKSRECKAPLTGLGSLVGLCQQTKSLIEPTVMSALAMMCSLGRHTADIRGSLEHGPFW